MRKLLRCLPLAVTAAVAVVTAGCRRSDSAVSAPDGAARIRCQLDWLPQTEYAGFYQARERGFYREAGLAVEIVPGGPGVPVKETVALQRAEIGSTDGNDVIVAIARGVPLVIVGAEMQRNPQGLLFHASHPLLDFRMLDGRTLMAGAGVAWVEFLSRSQKVKFDLLPLAADLTSFLADEAMVRQCFVTQEPFFARQKGAAVGTLLIAESGYDPYRVIYTSREFATKHPDAVRRFLAATVRGFDDFMDGDPAPGLGAVAQANPAMTPEVMAYSREQMRNLRLIQGRPDRGERTGQITRERIARQIEILRELGQIPATLAVDDVARFDLLPAAATPGQPH